MLKFTCSNCGKRFAMADKYAGRKGKCKNCGATVTIPAASTSTERIVIDLPMAAESSSQTPVSPPPVAKPKSRSSVRKRRLEAEFGQIRAAFGNSLLIQVEPVQGDPPEAYHVCYNVKGLARGPNGQPVVREQHIVEIQLTRDYPRQSPKCKMRTPIFHPNIEPAMICVGDHWTAGERLVDLIVRIGEMITFQAYNIKSPLDGEAAMWTDMQRAHLPIDNRNLHPTDDS